MTKPLFMAFNQGSGEYPVKIVVNMSLVRYIYPMASGGSALYFGSEDDAYLVVNESPDEIGQRKAWCYE